MGKYFTIAELTRSSEAIKHNIDNTPPPDVRVKLNSLINNLLDPIREKWGHPIRVNSGFRCPVLNKKVGGAVNSQHIKGEAADITTGNLTENERLFNMIIAMRVAGEIQFDQLIDEKGYRWIHISFSRNNRNQVLHV